MIGLTAVYWLLGAYFAALAWRGWRDAGNPRRLTTGLFWALLALLLFAAERMPVRLVGVCVVALVLIAGFGGLRMGRYAESGAEEKRAEAARLRNRLFWPALLIPAITLALTVGLKDVRIGDQALFDSANTLTLSALAVACVAALALDAAGVGQAVAGLVRMVIPVENAFLVVVAYALGMAVFTIIMGNAFAAFPVMTAGIGLPLLVQLHGADAAALAAIGMLSGYCGTLMTPMAANFNLVPAALLELKDPYGVIRAQWKTGALLLICNILLMYFIVFR
jgi:uncharacterized membrane protein